MKGRTVYSARQFRGWTKQKTEEKISKHFTIVATWLFSICRAYVRYALPTECFSICVICFDGCMIDLQHRPCHLCLHPSHLFFLIYLHRSIHLLRRINLHLLRHCTVKKKHKAIIITFIWYFCFQMPKTAMGVGRARSWTDMTDAHAADEGDKYCCCRALRPSLTRSTTIQAQLTSC